VITAAQTKNEMMKDPEWWKIPLLDFVDDFRYHKDPAAIAEPFDLSDDQKDAVLASVIETLCDESGIQIPEWVTEVPACREPYFMAGVESLKAIALVESPVRFRLRKIFVMENALNRV
jgi:hypothetical protein